MTNVIRLLRERLIPADPEPALTTPNPARTRDELGPRQIAWLARRVPHFRNSKRDADRVKAQQDRQRERYGQ